MTVNFTKMHGAGNDFIVIDDRDASHPWQKEALMNAIGQRRTGVGCEGIMFLQPPDSGSNADYRMRFLNPDGSPAGMCGNGARCAAFFAYTHGLAGRQQRILTDAGIFEAEIISADESDAIVCLTFTLPGPIEAKELSYEGIQFTAYYLNTGVAHAVLFVDNVAELDLNSFGKFVRHHEVFGSAGTNADFVEILASGSLHMRTFERGVEAESGACGTGAVASAWVAGNVRNLSLPLDIVVSSGDCLTVGKTERDGLVLPTLTGPSSVVFRGSLELDHFRKRIS